MRHGAWPGDDGVSGWHVLDLWADGSPDPTVRPHAVGTASRRASASEASEPAVREFVAMLVDQLQERPDLVEVPAPCDGPGLPVPVDVPAFLEHREVVVVQLDAEGTPVRAAEVDRFLERNIAPTTTVHQLEQDSTTAPVREGGERPIERGRRHGAPFDGRDSTAEKPELDCYPFRSLQTLPLR